MNQVRNVRDTYMIQLRDVLRTYVQKILRI